MKKRVYLITAICILIDQITKLIIVNTFKPFTGITVIKKVFELMYVKNEGAAWGILNSNLPILIFIGITAVYLLASYIKKEENISKLMIISYGLLLGGIIGNLIDRIFLGYVIDFLHFYIFKYSYPVFNMADTFIVVGILLMLIEVVRSDLIESRSRRKQKQN